MRSDEFVDDRACRRWFHVGLDGLLLRILGNLRRCEMESSCGGEITVDLRIAFEVIFDILDVDVLLASSCGTRPTVFDVEFELAFLEYAKLSLN